MLTELGADSMDHDLAIDSLTGFLGDLAPSDYRRARFPEGVSNFDIYNFVFINFNYTSLLDDYIYLDQKQFVPDAIQDRGSQLRLPGQSGENHGAPPSVPEIRSLRTS